MLADERGRDNYPAVIANSGGIDAACVQGPFLREWPKITDSPPIADADEKTIVF
jgi:hypothetical protein